VLGYPVAFGFLFPATTVKDGIMIAFGWRFGLRTFVA